MNVTKHDVMLSDAPCSIYMPENRQYSGTVLFYHGLFSSRVKSTKECAHLARAGIMAVAVDNYGHGDRQRQSFTSLMRSPDKTAAEDAFIHAVRMTAGEVPALIDCLISKGYTEEDKIGVCGISMGGYICYGACLADRRISCAAPILGSPRYSEESDSPHKNPHNFYPVAILSQNGGADISVPPHDARNFHKSLVPYYKDNSQLQSYIEFPGAGHFMPEHDFKKLWQNVINWFAVNLKNGEANQEPS